MHLNIRKIALYATIAVYLGSLLLPGLTQTNEIGQTISQQYGYEILIIGWIGVFAGILSWYGYLLGIISFFSLRAGAKTRALVCSAVGLLMALQALYLQTVNAQINFLDSYNSWSRGMGQLSLGYYVWLVALGLLTIQCLIAYMAKSANQTK